MWPGCVMGVLRLAAPLLSALTLHLRTLLVSSTSVLATSELQSWLQWQHVAGGSQS